MKQTVIVFAVLVVTHTITCVGVYQWLAQVAASTPLPAELGKAPETTTQWQRMLGQRSFVSADTMIVGPFVPVPLRFYTCAGYLGLFAALGFAWWRRSQGAPE